jgi:hypothetical protein
VSIRSIVISPTLALEKQILVVFLLVEGDVISNRYFKRVNNSKMPANSVGWEDRNTTVCKPFKIVGWREI